MGTAENKQSNKDKTSHLDLFQIPNKDYAKRMMTSPCKSKTSSDSMKEVYITLPSGEGGDPTSTSASTDQNAIRKPTTGRQVEECVSLDEQTVFWAPFLRKLYSATKAKLDEMPSQLKQKLKDGSTAVRFLEAGTYSMLPTKRLESFGNNEHDEKRAKRDPKGYTAALKLLRKSSSNSKEDSDVKKN